MSGVTLTEGTKIPLKTVIPVIAVVISVGFWVRDGISRVQHEVAIQAIHSEHTRDQVGDLKQAVSQLSLEVNNDLWRHSEMTRWASRLRAENPSLRIPEIE